MNELYVNIKNGTASCFIASFFSRRNRIEFVESSQTLTLVYSGTNMMNFPGVSKSKNALRQQAALALKPAQVSEEDQVKQFRANHYMRKKSQVLIQLVGIELIHRAEEKSLNANISSRILFVLHNFCLRSIRESSQNSLCQDIHGSNYGQDQLGMPSRSRPKIEIGIF